MSESFLNGRVVLHAGDSRDVLKTIADNSIDSICTDPPYALVSIVKRFGRSNMETDAIEQPPNRGAQYKRLSKGFMGKQWDNGETAFAVEFWQECLRVLKPGGHVVSFSGTRTFHRMVVAIEDAGFEIRDQIGWAFGSGFPKSHNVAIGIDKASGAIGHRGKGFNTAGESKTTISRPELRSDHPDYKPYDPVNGAAWNGWGTALKPAWEPICLARKPLSEKTVAANVLQHGTGAINVDACRVAAEGVDLGRNNNARTDGTSYIVQREAMRIDNSGDKGRWPANIIHDGSDEVIAAFPDLGKAGVAGTAGRHGFGTALVNGGHKEGTQLDPTTFGDAGSAARFFYTAKADADDRLGSKHPTVKPVDLMQWLCRLVTPKGGTVLDPFAGTGTTGEAAFRDGFNAVLIEREEEYQADIRRRMALVMSGPDERKRESIKAKLGDVPFEAGSLFA